MQLLLTSAAHSNIGQGGDTIIQTQNCVSPCAWVKLIFSVSRIVILAQGPCSLHTQFSKRLDLCVSSLSRSPLVLHREKKKKKKKPEFVRVILVQAIPLYRSKKNISDLDCHSCAGAMKQYPESQRSEEETPSSLRRMQQCPEEDKASGSSRSSYLRTSTRGFHRFAPREHHGRSFRRRRGGDVSGAASAPSLVVARLLARALALDLACGIRCPPFFIRKAYASDGSSTPRRKSSAMR